MQITAIIPTLDPDEKLYATVTGLQAVGFDDILLVDDGSAPSCEPLFARLAALPGVTLLHHDVNRGKGRALKTAFAYVLEHRPDSRGVLTVDGDGQHRPEDARRVAIAMERDPGCVYLGVRDFTLPQVPLRSRFGNRLTCLVFRLLSGLRLQDTQTGLRGIPRGALEPFLTVAGERFEYETNMLLEMCRCQMRYDEITIETVYLEENRSSHFRAVQDSLRIYWILLRFFLCFVGSSLVCFALDLTLFTVLDVLVFAGWPEAVRIFVATAVARLVSSLCNFLLNRRAVFHSHRSLKSTLWRYYLLSGCQLLCSAFLVSFLGTLLPLQNSIVKSVVDTCLFFVSYNIQRRYIFT